MGKRKIWKAGDSMSDAVIVAIVTLVGTIITVLAANKHTLAELDKKSELSDSKIQGEIDVIKADIRTLSNRVEAHNKLVERTYALESHVNVLDEQVKGASQRIEELKRGA